MLIGIDLMGSDQPPQLIFEAILQLCEEIPSSQRFAVIVQRDILEDLQKSINGQSIELVASDEFVSMEDSPLLAVRRKKNSSMAVGMRLLKESKIDALVSMGNTGALIASAMIYLKRLPTVEWPALMVTMPNDKGGVCVLDVGANIHPKPAHLVGYAKMAAAYKLCMDGLKNPRIGLLNIGVEEQKGTKAIQETYSILQEEFGNDFVGNVEGREVFYGTIDILVTDGFTGNVFLKTCEGVSSFLTEYLRDKFASKGSFEMKKMVHHLYKQFSYSEHPGALLTGLEKIVVKCHGYSDIRALKNGIKGAISLADHSVIEKLRSVLENHSGS